jgi:DNA-binding Xre family transcriptional regulator
MSTARAAVKRTARIGRGKVGSSFDALMKETGDYDAVKATALKRVLAWQISQEMKAQGVTKTELAARMSTSRSQLDRLLDPNNDEVTLSTLSRAAQALGREIRLELA